VSTPESPSLADRRQIEAWIEEAKTGSVEALGELLAACQLYLLGVARRRIPAQLQAKVSPSDLVQETSVAAHRGIGDFRGERLEELLAWLREILLCNAANAWRGYQATGMRRISREIPINEYSDVANELRDGALSPRSQLIDREERRRVEDAIARLSEDHRQVILLRSRDRLSFVEIGEQMQRSADAVRKLWMRAVACLEQECDR
jgi:RNA polymerase sigma-70 factor (ECF subfamily)